MLSDGGCRYNVFVPVNDTGWLVIDVGCGDNDVDNVNSGDRYSVILVGVSDGGCFMLLLVVAVILLIMLMVVVGTLLFVLILVMVVVG